MTRLRRVAALAAITAALVGTAVASADDAPTTLHIAAQEPSVLPEAHGPRTAPRPARSDSQPSRGNRRAGVCRDVLASFYGAGERLNRHAADGSVFDPTAATIAHRTLPLGTPASVNGLAVTVTDRGPAAWTGADVDLAAVGVWDALDLNRNLGRTTVRLCH